VEKVIAFDTETKGLAWHDPNEQAFLATWANETDEYQADLSKPEEVAQFRAAIDEADVVVAHNLKFDLHMVRETLGFDPSEGKILHDTDLMSRVLYPEGQRKGARGGHGLKNLATVFLKADAADPEEAVKEMAKAIGLRTIKQTGAYFDVWRAYPDVMEEYARQDARYTFDLYDKFQSAIGDLGRVYELEMAVLPILVRAEQRGVAVDQAKVAELKARFTEERGALGVQLAETFGEQALGGEGSSDALTDALLDLGVPLTETTDTGKLATNKFALQKFEKDFPILGELEEYRRYEKFLATYIGPMDGVEVIHPSFMQCGAWTGRMSCRSPNLQNWPKRASKEVRAVLVPRAGHAFVVADYESIEARLLAYYLNDQGYRDLYRGDHDPHAVMAANIFGGAVEDYLKGTPGQPKRDISKNATYAIVYGAGAPRMVNMLIDAGYDFKINMEHARRYAGEGTNVVMGTVEQYIAMEQKAQAKALISKIKASLPNFYRLQKRIKQKIESVGHVNTLFGRKQVVNPEKSYVGLNALIQGSAADIMKQGLVNVDAAVRDLGAHVLLVVHDEVVVEVPIDRAEECQRRVDEALTDAYQLDPPLSVESSITETSYADC
jgi:DNA polymerase-1